MNLPSQKLFFVAIPLIVIVGAFVMFKKPTINNAQPTNNPIKTVSIKNAIINEVDSDNDGLKDWEELIWKTDPNNPKTYGEVSDSDYVKAQLEKNPSQKLSSGPITNTENLGEQLFAEYIALKQDGQINSISINQLTNRLANSVSSNTEIAFYSSSALKTFADADKQKVQSYANKLVQTRNSYSQRFSSAATSLNTNANSFSDGLSFGSELYLEMASEIMKFEVPAGLAEAHTSYANALLLSAEGLRKLSSLNTDPLQGIVGIQQHTSGQENQNSVISLMTSFMAQSGIINFNLQTL